MSVYFITARLVNRVKIGCAFNPQRRLDYMQTSSPVLLKLEAVVRGAYEEERELHARFDRHRVRGEWFDITPEIECLIAANPAPATLTKDDLHFLMPPEPPREPEEQAELRELQERLERGDIHYPFRERIDA